MDNNPSPASHSPESNGPTLAPPPIPASSNRAFPLDSRKDRSLTPQEKKVGCISFGVFCLGIIMIIGTCGRSGAEDKSVEYKIACIDAGKELDADAPEVVEFRTLLDDLAKRFDTTDSQIAAATITAVDKMKEYGIETSNLKLMRAAHRAGMSESSKSLGISGIKGYSSILGMLAAQMEGQ